MLLMWRGHYYSWSELLVLAAIVMVIMTIWIVRDYRRERDKDDH